MAVRPSQELFVFGFMHIAMPPSVVSVEAMVTNSHVTLLIASLHHRANGCWQGSTGVRKAVWRLEILVQYHCL